LTHVITREEIIKLAKDPETAARFDNNFWEMGDDAYMVELDMMHVSFSTSFKNTKLVLIGSANPLSQSVAQSSF
jgi:hypothetical protein